MWAQATACRGVHRHASALACMPGRSQATVALALSLVFANMRRLSRAIAVPTGSGMLLRICAVPAGYCKTAAVWLLSPLFGRKRSVVVAGTLRCSLCSQAIACS